jgi:hypothetical protein
VEPRDVAPGQPTAREAAEALGRPRVAAPLWANRHLRLGLLLACLLGALVALLDMRAAWFGLGAGSAQAGAVTFPAGCPGREAPRVRSVATRDLPALRAQLSRIVPAGVGRRYQAGPVATSNLWTDDEPRPAPTAGPSAPAAYEVRWWALDRAGSEDDVGGDVLEFATAQDARRALALAASTRCRSDAAARSEQSPAGARKLSWRNPDGAQEFDVMFVRGRRLYRTVDVPPGYLLDDAGPRQDALERARASATADLLACALSDAGCPPSAAPLRDTSLAELGPSPATAAGGPSPPTAAQASAYAHAVNLRGYDVPGRTLQAPEGPLRDPGYWSAFARCTGGLRSIHPVAAIHSPLFAYASRREGELLYSTVAVLPSSGLASRFIATLESARARACVIRGYEGLLGGRAATSGVRAAGPTRLTRLATVAPPSYRGPGPYRAVRLIDRLAFVSSRGRRRRLALYVEGFVFARGPAVVELSSVSFVHPFRESDERFLEALLVGSAEANEASL